MWNTCEVPLLDCVFFMPFFCSKNLSTEVKVFLPFLKSWSEVKDLFISKITDKRLLDYQNNLPKNAKLDLRDPRNQKILFGTGVHAPNSRRDLASLAVSPQFITLAMPLQMSKSNLMVMLY